MTELEFLKTLRKLFQTNSYDKAIEMVSNRITELSPKKPDPMNILRTNLNDYTIIKYAQVKEQLSSYSFQENMNYLIRLGYVNKVCNGWYQLVKRIPDDLESVTKPNNNRRKSQKSTIFYHRMRNQIITKFNSNRKDGSIFFLEHFLERMFTTKELTYANKKNIELFLLNLREDGYISQNGYGGLKAVKEIPANYCAYSLPVRKTNLPIGFNQLKNL